MQWTGVMPAMTTCFNDDLAVDHVFMSSHARWMIDNGCTGIVLPGSLGEAATLDFEEKKSILTNVVRSLDGRAPVVAAISALSTRDAVAQAKAAADAGCAGVMVLRKRSPELPRPFRAPFMPVTPILGIVISLAMMLGLPIETWERLVIWLIVGLLIYFTYSVKHSKVQQMKNVVAAD